MAKKAEPTRKPTRPHKRGARGAIPTRTTPRGFAEDKTKWVASSENPAPQTGIAKLFMNGRSQAVRLPKEFRLPGNEVRVRREGDTILLTPMKRDLAAVWAAIDRLGKGTFPERPEQPPMPDDDDDLSWD